MPRVKVKTPSKTQARNFPTICVRQRSREDVLRIGGEWRMNIQETVAALIDLWDNATDEQRIDAIRKPAREAQTA